jgi:hypothetical protein
MLRRVHHARASSFGIGKRRSARLTLSVRGRLTSERGTQMVEIVDLSETGARLILSARHDLSEAGLEWLDFAARGRVVWQDKRLCGLQFDEVVPLEWVARTRSPA